MPHKSQLINHNMFESLEKLTAAVEAACADIAPSYAEYVQLAMAIATDCGEGGRADFHRICSFSPKYQSSHADRLYTNALKNGHGNVHLGTAFHLAQTAGVEIREEKRAKDTKNALNAENAVPPFSHTHAHVSYNADGNGQPDTTDTADCREEKLSGSEPLLPLPLLPEAEWPEPLQHIRSYGATGAQRDVLLLGALTVLGACMERNARCLYGGKMQSPCLQTFVVAPSAAGKGILGFVRLLIEPIHDEIRRQVEQQMSAYKKAKSSYNAMGKDRRCRPTGCSSYRATTQVQASCRISWIPTERESSLKRKRTPYPPLSAPTTAIGATRCAGLSTMTSSRTTDVRTKNTAKSRSPIFPSSFPVLRRR